MEEQQFAEEQDQIKKNIIKILQAIRANNPLDLAPYTLYRGNDKERNLRFFVNIDVEEDKSLLMRLTRRIQRYMENSDGYSLSQFYTEEDADGFWYVWEVIFNKGVDRKICYLRFLKINSSFGLGDIDD